MKIIFVKTKLPLLHYNVTLFFERNEKKKEKRKKKSNRFYRESFLHCLRSFRDKPRVVYKLRSVLVHVTTVFPSHLCGCQVLSC